MTLCRPFFHTTAQLAVNVVVYVNQFSRRRLVGTNRYYVCGRGLILFQYIHSVASFIFTVLSSVLRSLHTTFRPMDTRCSTAGRIISLLPTCSYKGIRPRQLNHWPRCGPASSQVLLFYINRCFTKMVLAHVR